MPNVNEGLQKPDANEAVNSEAGFAAILAGRGVEPDAADQAATDTSVAGGLETVEPGKDRGPDGRFLPKQTPETPETTQDTSTEVAQVQVTSDDPAVSALLAKYDGDPVKALKAAADAQSVIGRQGHENGQLKERLANLEGRLEQLAVVATATQPALLSDEQIEERAANLIAAKGDYTQAATEAANAGYQSGDLRTYDSILEQWVIEDPIGAQRFDFGFQLWQRDQAAPTAATPASDQWVEDRKAEDAMTTTMNRLKSEIGDEAYVAITTSGADGESPMTRALASMPKAVIGLVASSDPEEQYIATQLVADRARLLSGAAAAAPTEDSGLPASVQRKLAGAGVATAGLRPVSPPAGAPQSKEDAVMQFKRDLLAAETTSVASGLTYGPQKVA